MFASEYPQEWDEWIPLYLVAYRFSKSTQLTPSMVLYGEEIHLPTHIWRGSSPEKECNNAEAEYTICIIEKMRRIHQFVRHCLDLSSTKMKICYDSHVRPIVFVIGKKVWLFQPRRRKGKCPKLQSDWEGLYTVVDKLNIIYRIRRSPRCRCKVNHLAKHEGQKDLLP
ncbi:uncharacterized protein LOC143185956 [Calliopsis andreniformis]|uniref:uncharacterized protein LOC143185956 n=1 Tax=Calliopsis andreniformis TaxID=337506 RepID=UPI003FCD90F1